MGKIRVCILSVITASVLTAGTIYYGYIGPNDDNYRQLRTELDRATEDNRRITELEKREGAALERARELIEQQLDSYTKLRALIKVLRDYYASVNNTSNSTNN